jgi:hypothetical protein
MQAVDRNAVVLETLGVAQELYRPQSPERRDFPGPEFHPLGLLADTAHGLQVFAQVINYLMQSNTETIVKLKAEVAELKARVGALEGAGGGDAAVFDSGDTFGGGN